MKITKVNYTKSYTIGPFLQEKVGFEAEIDGTCESPESALNELKRIADQWHIANNPQVHVDTSEVSLPEIKVEKKPEEVRIGIFIEDILSCQDIPTIDSYRFLVKSDPALQAAYDKRREEIKQAEIKGIMDATEDLRTQNRNTKKAK
jgi:hypothetical protein